MKNREENIADTFEQSEKEAVSLASKLIKFESVNPPGDVTEIANYLVEYLEKEDLEVRTFEPEEGRRGILAEVGDGNVDRTLILNGHMDVVPPGDISKWDFPPYSGKRENGFIYGRGASDMKAGLAGIVVAFITAAKSENMPGNLMLMLVPDEETGGCWGTKYFLENQINYADGCLIAEPSGIYHPTIGQKGALWLKISASGIPAHGSLYPFEGQSAIMKINEVIEVLSTLPERSVKIPDEIREIVDYSKEVIADRQGDGHGGEPLDTLTCNVGTISGGDKLNKVPESCEIEVDIRVPLGRTSEEVLKMIKDDLKSRDISVEIEAIKDPIDPNYTSPEEPIVTSVIDSINNLQDEKEAGPTLQWASSDAKYFRQHGIPTIQYGPAELEGIHSFNEKVKISDVKFATRVYTAIIGNFMFQ